MTIVLLGLWSAFIVEFIRAIEWPKAWRARKPLSCDLCMVSWTLLSAMHFYWVMDRVPPYDSRYAPAGVVALLVLALLKYWRGLSMVPPE